MTNRKKNQMWCEYMKEKRWIERYNEMIDLFICSKGQVGVLPDRKLNIELNNVKNAVWV